jgi:hypothetical protein
MLAESVTSLLGLAGVLCAAGLARILLLKAIDRERSQE